MYLKLVEVTCRTLEIKSRFHIVSSSLLSFQMITKMVSMRFQNDFTVNFRIKAN